MAEPVLCLHHEDRWYYWLPSSYGSPQWIAESGDPTDRFETLTRVPRDHNGRWYVGSFEADRIAKVTPQPGKIVGYELADTSAHSARFPATLTVDEMAARRPSDEDADYPERGLYRPITEPQPNQVEYIAGPWVRADGEPAPKDGRTWVATLPYQLSQHTELLHLFPGRLTGFRDVLAARLKQIPGVSDVWTHQGFEVVARLPYDPPRFGLLKEHRRKRPTPEFHSRRQTYQPPRDIAGPNRAAAAETWDRTMAQYIAAVTELATARPCGHCAGSGIAPTGKAHTDGQS